MSNEKQYSYNIEISLMDDDQSMEEEVFNQDFHADNTQELAKLVKPVWDHWKSVIENKADERYKKYDMIFIWVWNVFRICDRLDYGDDDTIPEGSVVQDDLINILDPLCG